MTAAARVARIRAALEASFAPQQLAIHDESERHRGHAGAASGAGHFRVEMVASSFAGQSPLQRHRRVYEALASLMRTDIHALSLRLRAPGEDDPDAAR